MKLILGPDDEHESPSEADIESALAALPGGHDSFAILAASDEVWVQTSGGGPDGFVLEYREGGSDEHYRSADTAHPLPEVVAVFRAYARGESIAALAPWEPAEPPPRSARHPLLFLGAGILIVVAAAYLVARAVQAA